MTETTFDESLTTAELSCFAMLCTRLGLDAGANAFVSVRGENAADCIVFDIGYVQTGDTLAFDAEQFHFRASADIYGRSRAEVQKWIMRLVRAFPVGAQYQPDSPLREDSNVLEFRIAPETKAIGPVLTQEIQTKAGGAKIPVFCATVLFDVVFATGPRDEN